MKNETQGKLQKTIMKLWTVESILRVLQNENRYLSMNDMAAEESEDVFIVARNILTAEIENIEQIKSEISDNRDNETGRGGRP